MATLPNNDGGENKSQTKMFCEPCRKEGLFDVYAEGFCVDCSEYFCRTCLKFHAKFLPRHVQQDKATMPQEFCFEPCTEHTTDTVKYYCDTCKTVACFLCKERSHRQCLLRHIPSIVNGIEESNEFKKFCSEIESANNNVKDAENEIAKHLKEHKLLTSEAVKSIKKQREIINEYLDQQEKIMISQIEKIKTSASQKSATALQECSQILHELDSISSTVHQIKSDGQRSKLFIKMKTCSSRLADIGNKLSLIRENAFVKHENYNNITHGSFAKLMAHINDTQTEDNRDSSEKLSDVRSNITDSRRVGTIRVNKENKADQSNQPKSSVRITEKAVRIEPVYNSKMHLKMATFSLDTSAQTSMFKLEHVITVQENVDEVSGMISGLCLVSDQYLVAVDQDRALLLAIDTTYKESRQILGGYDFSSLFSAVSGRPWDVTTVGDMRVAVSMPVAGNIVFMTLKTRKILSKIIPNSISFTKDKTVSVGIGCTGLAFTSGHFLVVCFADGYDSKKSQSRVQIVDLAGNILKKIPNDTLNEQLFQQATDVAVSPDQTKIYVSDSSDNALVLVSQDGTVTKVISDTLFEPMGLSVDEDGLVYVCAGGKVHQVAPDLSTGREITITGDNADRIVPLSLVYCIVTKRLFVGFEKNIKVFKKIK